ncbi:plasmid stabilization protein [Rhizobium rhizosphaerae]|uniref:Plasmid stabilization protein n=1 Tax=Xaviernesmea rhizosphaerae TaxID=1672749 RepID=A0A1Q9AKZ3_9HYPH|nr:type II toxin-antitoxin system VapB family antitoxin [Xaviernesmea rhizosphaerae]OLP55941.1 plasmid stabilization protein [Xaviernesmea rhizosphaerae]
MAEPQFSIPSRKAQDLANRLARRENLSVMEVVERALEAYESRRDTHEPAAAFYQRIAERCGTDLDLDAVIQDGRAPHAGVDL